jgi:hypothetical protein
VARGKTTEVRPPDRTSDRYFVLIRELPLRPLRSDGELDQAIADFSVAYADQNERDYAAFVDALKSGRLIAQTDV